MKTSACTHEHFDLDGRIGRIEGDFILLIRRLVCTQCDSLFQFVGLPEGLPSPLQPTTSEQKTEIRIFIQPVLDDMAITQARERPQ
jgi:hypothetical protein